MEVVRVGPIVLAEDVVDRSADQPRLETLADPGTPPPVAVVQLTVIVGIRGEHVEQTHASTIIRLACTRLLRSPSRSPASTSARSGSFRSGMRLPGARTEPASPT